MAQSIPSVPIAPASCRLVGSGGGDLSENLCPWVGHLSKKKNEEKFLFLFQYFTRKIYLFR